MFVGFSSGILASCNDERCVPFLLCSSKFCVILTKAYGDELEWTFEDKPRLEKDARRTVGEEMPRGPAIFVDGRVSEGLEKSETTTRLRELRGVYDIEIDSCRWSKKINKKLSRA